MNDRMLPSEEDTQVPRTEAAGPVADRRVADRRRPSLWSILRGGLSPRRRDGRRAGDQAMPIDWHDPYLLFLAVTMLLLSVADAFMTIRLLANGAVESNPLLALVLNSHPELFAAVKMALTGLGVVVLVAVARIRLLGLISARWLFQGLVLAYVALVGYEIWLVSALP